jgi:four helix bundle protein
MNKQGFQDRTKTFGLRVIRVFRALPKDNESQMMGRQLIRCATSVGSNYRAACRARSRADIIAKLKVVEEESNECAYWMELLVESDCLPYRCSKKQMKSLRGWSPQSKRFARVTIMGARPMRKS